MFYPRVNDLSNHDIFSKITVYKVKFPSIEQAFNLTGKQLVTSHLLCHYYISGQVGNITFQDQAMSKTMNVLMSHQPAQHLLAA